MPSLILASQSPRRKELLEQAGYTFTTKKSEASEHVSDESTPAEAVEELAARKAEASHNIDETAVIIGADTVVAIKNDILEKPSDTEEARAMLKRLSGATHSVYTGVAVKSENDIEIFHVKTDVTFYKLEDGMLEAYLSTDEPYDKAGAYGIQGKGRLFVRRIEGDYFNVVGLPIARLARELSILGIYPSFSRNVQ
ncbi:Maf family protein [Alteribacillus sp. HJP-4]|uniref:Maf family protein n=1 Tax=Alteribacillus sp. HJP-4 TaxID=2775394 RepID=UPI0035CCFBE6